MPCSVAASKNGMAPNRLPWSVTATAGMSYRAACSTSSSSLDAPSRRENCEWLCRCTKLLRAIGSLLPLDRGGRLAAHLGDPTIHPAHFVHDPGAGPPPENLRQTRPIRVQEIL